MYDEDGQLASGTMMDYAVPRASQMPRIETGHTVTPSPVNPLGVKGCGEAGTIASAAARRECGVRCALAVRDPAHRQAADACPGVGRDPGGASRRNGNEPAGTGGNGRGWRDDSGRIRVRAGGVDQGCADRARGAGRHQGASGRPQPDPDDEVSAGAAAATGGHRRARRAPRHRRTPARRPDRRHDHLSRDPRLGAPARAVPAHRRGHRLDRRRAGPEPRHDRRRARARRPGSGHASGDGGARRHVQPPREEGQALGARRASSSADRSRRRSSPTSCSRR